MIRSMTAFARREREGDWGQLAWELRSVNHRYLEVHPRLPEELRSLEPMVRERLAERLGRGKVECSLRFASAAGATAEVTLNTAYADQVVAACEALRARMSESAAPSPEALLALPGVLRESARDLAPVAEAASALLDEALDDLLATREREGARLDAILRERAEGVAVLAREVRERRVAVNQGVRDRLRQRIEDLGVSADEGRLEQEVAIIAQRLDVDEELERLLAHVEEVVSVLGRDEPIGRRLDFLMQELNREANTLGSKSSDAQTTRAAVDMKVLIEQMREQVQNLE